MRRIVWCTWTSIKWEPKLRIYHESVTRCLLSQHRDSISSWLLLLPTESGKHAVINRSSRYVPRTFRCIWSSIICQQKLQLCHGYVRCVSYFDTRTEYCLDSHCAKWDWQISSAQSVIMRLIAYTEDSPVYLNEVECWLLLCFHFIMPKWPQGSGAPQIPSWRMVRTSSVHYSPYSTHVIYHELGQLGTWKIAYQLTLSRIGH